MSTSDSEYSIDWLASDEDEYDSPKTLSPQHADEPPAPPSPSPPSSSSSSSSSTSSLRESPSSCFHCGVRRRRRKSDCKDGGLCGVDADSPAALQAPAVSPVQGFTSVYTQQMLSVESKHHSSRKRALSEKPRADTESQLFLQKCMELQCYIQPLSSILQGLRSGRYSERLSSFQESVAMDRIQKIMGVLQNPNMGGRFLGIVVKIEDMLQSWFPHIKPDLPRADGGPLAKKQKQLLGGGVSPPPSSRASLCSSDVESALAASDSSIRLKRLHTSPACSLKVHESTLGRPATSASASPLPARCSQEVTQDNAVSSSSDLHTGPLRRLSSNPRLSQGTLPFKISSPCLERLLQAKESIIAPRTAGDGGWLS